ncbi:hypothetical protein HD806DRAFT_510856 [Xylariaceae sp. AK1471]|nr:hypothetical protein HD806DRAFT_510856 [Xylariaceae sp. AK1471]
MAGIVPSLMDAKCNTHNALQNISGYACGVTFAFKDSENPPDMHYGVVSLQRCCDEVKAPLLRIPGNTGCEIQYCVVEPVTSSYTETIYYGYATGSGTAAQTPAPSVTTDARIGPPEAVTNCMLFVYEGDLPDDISEKVSDASSWSVVRFYDDELPPEDVSAAVLASPAPPSWTSAAANPWDKVSPNSTPATPTSSPKHTPASSAGHGSSCHNEIGQTSLIVWTVTALATIGLIISL